jgi:hypothetical protein
MVLEMFVYLLFNLKYYLLDVITLSFEKEMRTMSRLTAHIKVRGKS